MAKFINIVCIIIGVLNMITAIEQNNTPQAILGAMICVFGALNIRTGY